MYWYRFSDSSSPLEITVINTEMSNTVLFTVSSHFKWFISNVNVRRTFADSIFLHRIKVPSLTQPLHAEKATVATINFFTVVFVLFRLKLIQTHSFLNETLTKNFIAWTSYNEVKKKQKLNEVKIKVSYSKDDSFALFRSTMAYYW